MIESDGFNSPPLRGKLEQFTRRYKDGGGGSKAAILESQKSREQSASQFSQQMAFMQKQYKDAQNVKPVSFLPASPASQGSSDVYAQGIERRRRQMSRFGSAATALNPPVLGGAMPLAA